MTAPDQPAEVAEVYSEEGYYAVIPEWVLDADISALAVRLYAVLRRYADQRTMHAHPSRKTLAERLRVKSVRTVDTAIAELKGIGALRTFGRVTAAGDQDSNGYVLHRSPRFDTTEAPPKVAGEGAARGGAADCTTPPGAADCATPGAADCATPVQQTAHEPQPPNHSHGNHRGDVPEVRHQREVEAEQPPLEQPDGVNRTCPTHRLTPAVGACRQQPYGCGDWRRAVEARTAQGAVDAAQRAQVARDEARAAAEYRAAELRSCRLCDDEGRLPTGLACLHDPAKNARPDAGGYAEFQRLRAQGIPRVEDGRDPGKGRRRVQAEREG